MPRLTKALWAEVREDWHEDVLKNREICEKYDISEATLRSHAKGHDWRFPRNRQVVPGQRAGYQRDYGSDTTTGSLIEVTEIEAASVSPTFEPPAPHDFGTPTDHDKAMSTGDLAALLEEERTRRIAAEARALVLEKESADLRPWVEVDMYETVEDVIRILGTGRIKDLVAGEFASINRQRTLDGYERYTLTDAEMDERMGTIAKEILDERYKFEDENPHRSRVLKMVHPNGNLVQIPAEDQINNMRGSRSDWYTIYTDRGFKVLVDRKSGATVCGSLNCWRPAVKDERGNYIQLGYCSEGHRRWVEGNKPQSPILTPVGANTTGREVSRTGLAR